MLRVNHIDTHLIPRAEARIQKNSTFYNILYAALNNDQLEIERLSKDQFFLIDVKMGFSFGLITPAGYLEFLERYEAVDLLIRNGAGIDDIAFAAAMNGNRPRAEYLRKHYGASPTAIARGAATGGDIYYAQRLFILNGANLDDILIGSVNGNKLAQAIDLISTYKSPLKYDRYDEFWRAVGMNIGAINADVIRAWNACRDTNFETSELELGCLHDFYHGAGMSGLYDVDQDCDVKLRGSFISGAIEGSRHESIPEQYYKPQPKINYYDDIFKFETPMKGCNLDYVKRCFDGIQSDRSLRIEFYASFYYYTKLSNNNQLISRVPRQTNLLIDLVKHGHRLPRFDIYRFTDHTFKSLSYIFKTRNPNLIDELQIGDFLFLLPNKNIATHLMAFDDNEAFQEKLLERFNQFKWTDRPHDHYDFHEAFTLAGKIKTLAKKYHFNYTQAMAILTFPDLRHFLLNTCKDITKSLPGFNRDMYMLIISELGNLLLIDAADLIEKVKHYRFVMQDILRVADDFRSYAATHSSEQAAHAASLSCALHEVRTKDDAFAIVNEEKAMLERAPLKPLNMPANTLEATYQSVCTFFNNTLHKAKSLYDNDNRPTHHKPYNEIVDDKDYNVVVDNGLMRLGSGRG